MVELMAGQVQMMFQTGPGSLAQIKAGKVRAIVVTGTKRYQLLPEVPTTIESGYADFEANGWNGLVVPTGTPASLVAKLNSEVVRIMKDPGVLQKITDTGWEPVSVGSRPREFAEFIRREMATYGKAIKDTGVKID